MSDTTQVTNQGPQVTLGAIGHNSTAHPWFYCADFHKITAPSGTVSAYPYGPNTFAWKLQSPGPLVTATELNLERVPVGGIQISFVNAATSSRSASATFDCSTLYPGYGITGVQVQSINAITSTTATITWQLHATVLGTSNILSSSTWHIEYGTTPNDYRTVSPSQTYISQGPNGMDPRSMTLSGLTPGAAYHFRVVMDVKAYNDHGNLQASFSDPNNSFTTATE